MKIGLFKGSRVNILAIFLFASFLVIVARLFYVQIISHSKYVAIGEEQHIKQLTIPAKRGEIYTYDGGTPTVLVMNSKIYTVFLDPQIVDEPAKVENVIKNVAGGNITNNIADALRDKVSRYQVVATKLSRTQAEMIKKEDLAGVGFQENIQRFYPEASLASQVLGFVNHDGAGQYGVEEALDQRLRGTDGRLQTVTDVNNVPLTIGDKNISVPAVDGDKVVLTIDRNVQSHTETALKKGLKKLKATKGSAVVMNPNTGHILAMANLPTYDVANYTKVTDAALFSNPILTDPYEAGSVIKPFTLAVGIDKNVITPSTTYYNRDYVTIDDRTIVNAVYGYTGNITMQTALNYSLNTGMVDIAMRLGDGNSINRTSRNTIYEYFHGRFGFGQATGVELYESAGQIISPDEVEGNAVRYSNMTFGQGMNLSMLQVTSAFGSIVTDGKLRTPTVVAGTMRDGNFVSETHGSTRQTVSTDTSSDIRKMLVKSRQISFAHEDKPGYTIGGKTGTSQVIVDGKYSDTTTIASYIGFGGVSSPEYVIMVRVQNEKTDLGGSTAAEPIFADISNWMIQYLNLKPRG